MTTQNNIIIYNITGAKASVSLLAKDTSGSKYLGGIDG